MDDILNQVSYQDIVYYLISSSVVLYGANKLSNYVLKRKLNPKKITDVFLPPVIIENQEKIKNNSKISKHIQEDIAIFCNVIATNFKRDDLKIFYNNIKGLKVKTNETKPFKKLFEKYMTNVAYYEFHDNEIEIRTSNYDLIYHELFHVASTIILDKKIYSGISQARAIPYIDIGDNLNEGYTQLLTERYFPNINFKGEVYQEEAQVAHKLEQIIGKDKMESLYLKADLYGLIEELSKYETEEKIMKFIAQTDNCNLYENEIEIFLKSCFSNKEIIRQNNSKKI